MYYILVKQGISSRVSGIGKPKKDSTPNKLVDRSPFTTRKVDVEEPKAVVDRSLFTTRKVEMISKFKNNAAKNSPN
jgi:hypothetical protein